MSDSHSSGGSGYRQCKRCAVRLSDFLGDPHYYCSTCRGKACEFSSRCDECADLTEEQFYAYTKNLRNLRIKSASKERRKMSLDDRIEYMLNYPDSSFPTGAAAPPQVLVDQPLPVLDPNVALQEV